MDKKTALITGATGGLGYELSKILAQEGYNLVLVARNQARLETTKHNLSRISNIAIETMALDLTIPTAPKELYERVQQQSLAIDLLVNNAGFGIYGRFDKTELGEELEMIQLNATALIQLTKFFVPDMLTRQNGKILNVASQAAFQPIPFFSVYAATKALVLSFSEALANELQGTGVSVSVLCPGAFRSGFQQRARMEHTIIFQSRLLLTAEEIAKIGYRGLKKNKRVIIPGWKEKMLVFSTRCAPLNLVTQIARYLVRERR